MLKGVVMRSVSRVLIVSLSFALGALTSFAEERAVATGRVADSSFKPLENALVMVYSARVRKGYSLFCPTCYRDCGKRTLTGPDGSYRIPDLDPDLIFTLVAVKDGYLAGSVANVDPAAGPAPDVYLKPEPIVSDATQIVHGKVVNSHGSPMQGALVQPDFAILRGPGGSFSFSSPIEWINEVALTNDKGEFDVSFSKPAVEMNLRVFARGMAAKHFTVPSGEERHTLIVTNGAIVEGRLVYDGKPVGGAEVRLIPHDSSMGRWYPEVRIGTGADGRFAITNVPPGRVWIVHPTMESLASRGLGAGAVFCETKYDGQEVRLGDITLKPAHALRGKVILSDGKPIPPDMHVTITADRSSDSQVVTIGSDGQFRAEGLTDGVYSVAPGVQGYRLEGNCSLLCRSVEILLSGDVSDMVLKMEPDLEASPRK